MEQPRFGGVVLVGAKSAPGTKLPFWSADSKCRLPTPKETLRDHVPTVSVRPRVCENYFASLTTRKNTHESSIVRSNRPENDQPEHSHASLVFCAASFHTASAITGQPVPIMACTRSVRCRRVPASSSGRRVMASRCRNARRHRLSSAASESRVRGRNRRREVLDRNRDRSRP